jgi:hypothetical protein
MWRTPEPLEAPPVDPLIAQIAREDELFLSETSRIRGRKCQRWPRALPFSLAAFSDPLPPELTYRPLPTLPFSRVAYSGRGEVDVVVVVVAGEPRHGRRRVSN